MPDLLFLELYNCYSPIYTNKLKCYLPGDILRPNLTSNARLQVENLSLQVPCGAILEYLATYLHVPERFIERGI